MTKEEILLQAESLAAKAAEILTLQGWHMTTAESCTGGMIASSLVSVSGASSVFREGLVTYSNEAKESLLGVRHETLDLFGAVSYQTAREMAFGARVCYSADFGLASTGIAGPEGGSDEKPVGTVFLSCSHEGNTVVRHYVFSGDRATVRAKTTKAAFELLLDSIQEKLALEEKKNQQDSSSSDKEA